MCIIHFSLQEAISDKWFCCTGCSAVCVALEKMPTEGKKVLPDCSSSILKRNFEQRGLQNDAVAAVRWQLLNGKHTKDKSLLKAANKLFQVSILFSFALLLLDKYGFVTFW